MHINDRTQRCRATQILPQTAGVLLILGFQAPVGAVSKQWQVLLMSDPLLCIYIMRLDFISGTETAETTLRLAQKRGNIVITCFSIRFKAELFKMRSYCILFKDGWVMWWQHTTPLIKNHLYICRSSCCFFLCQLFRSGHLYIVLTAQHTFDPAVIVLALKWVSSHLTNIQTKSQPQTKPHSLSGEHCIHSEPGCNPPDAEHTFLINCQASAWRQRYWMLAKTTEKTGFFLCHWNTSCFCL